MQSQTVLKYRSLLDDEDVARWVRNLERGSPVTAEVSLRRLGKASTLLGLTPKQIVTEAQANPKRFQDSLEDIVSKLEDEGKSPGYIGNIIKIIRHWLKYNNVILTRHIKIKNSSATPTIDNEQVPSQQELARLLRNSSSRIRVAEALMAFGDLRPETIGNFNGSDGLTLADLQEVIIENNRIEIKKVPTMIVVRSTLSKAKHKYFTFLGAEGCAYLKEYLEERIRSGEQLRPDMSVIAHERRELAKGTFMLTRTVTRQIRNAMRTSGIFKRPYVLRAYAETQLTIAESKGKIVHPFLQFIAGHKGDIESRYSTHKGSLPPEMVEGMREAYRQCEPFLSTFAMPTEQASTVKEAKIEALKSLAKSMFDFDLLEVKVAKERSVSRDLTQDEIIDLFESEMRRVRRTWNSQQIVTEEELPNRLMNGWSFVSALPSQRILVQKLAWDSN